MAKKNTVPVPKKPLKTRLWNQRYLFLLMLPGVIWVLVICYAPMTGLYMAFSNYKPSQNGYFYDLVNAKFVGWQWFEYFTSHGLGMILRNTLATSLLTLLFSFPAPIILAVLLNEVKHDRVKKFIQTASYLPYFISWVIAANIFMTFLARGGIINDILIGLHLTDTRIAFFQNGPYFWWIIALANTWKNVGYNAIIYLSAISGIDQQLYEAAEVDGANRVQRIWHITLPTIRPTISILLILAVGGILSTGFEQQLLMGNDSILNYSDVLDTYAYRMGLAKGMYSYGTAIGLFKSVVSFILVITANKITAKLNDSALF
jgi:putative aldouronate transport system permease protein